MPEVISKQNYIDLGGTIRTQTVLDTLNQLNPLLHKLGITRVANVTGLDCINIPVAVCIRPNSKHLTVSQGKGLTWELAMTSAIMESIEGYHAENAQPPIVEGSYLELKNDYPVINPELFTQGIIKVPNIQDWTMGWAKAKEISHNKQVLIPHVLSNLDSTIIHPEYSFFNVSSNGLAAGNTTEEAECHAIYEIIERDALYHWSKLPKNERIATQIKIATITSTLNQSLIEKIRFANQSIKIWDITSKLEIPTYHCVIKDNDPYRRLGIFSGTGTHLNKNIALSRAITEAAQSRLTLISGSRDDVFNDHYHKKYIFNCYQTDFDGARDFSVTVQPVISKNFTENLNYLIEKLYNNDYKEIFLINHTKVSLNIPVVHIFIPGMKYNGKRI